MEPVEQILTMHPFFHELPPAYHELIAGCSGGGTFGPGEFLLREGDYAATFYLIRHGRVSLEAYVPGRGSVAIQTLGDGDLLGWSWLFPPYRWHFDAQALTPVEVIAVDGACLRQQCEDDPALGFALMKRLSRTIIDRLQATRLQLLEIQNQEP
jgi:CRP-like cAMP-binding protein